MTDPRFIDPFKHIGKPADWGVFGGAQDEACNAEKRAFCDFFLRRLAKGEKRQNPDVTAHLLTGGITALSGLFISAAGGPDALDEDAFEKWIGIVTFSWYQAISCFDGGSVQ